MGEQTDARQAAGLPDDLKAPAPAPAPGGLRGFLKRWWTLCVFGVLALGFMAGYGAWRDRALDEPIAQPYQQLIDHLANGSPAARAHLQAYRERFGLDRVIARHYEAVCAVMRRLAKGDGVDTEVFADRIGPRCGYIAREWPGQELPPRR